MAYSTPQRAGDRVHGERKTTVCPEPSADGNRCSTARENWTGPGLPITSAALVRDQVGAAGRIGPEFPNAPPSGHSQSGTRRSHSCYRLAGARVTAFGDHAGPDLVSVDNNILDGQCEVVNLPARRLNL